MKTLVVLCALCVVPAAFAADAPAPKEKRFFEMRIYCAAPGKLDAMHARFRNHAVKLFEKHGITRKTVYTPTCNLGQLRQLEYGFGADALHHLAAAASGTTALNHTQNNIKILKDFEDKGKNYYKYKA